MGEAIDIADDAAVRFNPFDPDDVHEMWDRTRLLRRVQPVSRPAEGMVFVARYHDAKRVMRDRDHYLSGRGFRAPGVEVHEEERFIGEMDPPQHPRIRRIAVSALGPAAVEAEAPFTRDYADWLLERLPLDPGAADGGADLVSRYTTPLANAVPMHLIGAPIDDADQIERWGVELMHSDYPLYNRTEKGEGFGAAFPDYAAYIDDMVTARKADPAPPDDLMTRLIDAAPDGEHLSDRQIRMVIANMMLGGVSTTTNLLGNIFHVLVSDRELWAEVDADRALVPRMVEESLRHTPPIPVVLRTAALDGPLCGVEVAAGERVVIGISSANRDEEVYRDPDRFRLDRDPAEPEHLAFVAGPHVCLGAGLARLEAKVALEAFLDHFRPGSLVPAPGWSFTTGQIYMEYGPVDLRVVPA